MLIDLNNTRAIPGFMSQQPQDSLDGLGFERKSRFNNYWARHQYNEATGSRLHRRGAGVDGMGDARRREHAALTRWWGGVDGLGDTVLDPNAALPAFDPATVQAVNSELLFLMNMDRQSSGQPPINTAAPKPASNAMKAVAFVGGAMLLLRVLKSRRR